MTRIQNYRVAVYRAGMWSISVGFSIAAWWIIIIGLT
jgi:hypothetical protein